MLLKVVIVEDEEIIRNGLTFALNWLDMDCIIVGTAKDGAEGLETIRREQPDIVPVSYTHLDVYKRQQLELTM